MTPEGYTRAPYTYAKAGRIPADHHLLHVIDLDTGKPVDKPAEVNTAQGWCDVITSDGQTERKTGEFGIFYKASQEPTGASTEPSSSRVPTDTDEKGGGRAKVQGTRA